jgi:hypothetical protein
MSQPIIDKQETGPRLAIKPDGQILLQSKHLFLSDGASRVYEPADAVQ